MNKPNTYLEIDLGAIKNNVLEIKKRICPRILAVVKSNAYGHGAVEVVNALNNLVDGFMVDNPSEALEILPVAKKPILVMLANNEKEIEILAKNKIVFALFDFYQLSIIKKVSEKLGEKINVHLKIDTGMNRLGFKKSEWKKLKKDLSKYKNYLQILGIFSHFAKAEDK
ncbi:MAG: alanine racemase, partial [Patescibacteria group bacterium]|nr:alanine racemase [Patescibacteria group bacterium]